MSRNFTTDIINIIKHDIKSGKYDTMAFLPSERQLSENLNAGRGIIRTALRNLRDEGLLNLIPGRGARLIKKTARNIFKRFIVRCNYGPHVSNKSQELMGVLAGICMEASIQNAEAVVAFSETKTFIEEISERYTQSDIQGIIFIEDCFSCELISALKTIGIPHLVANQENDSSCVNCRMNFRDIGRMAGRRLVEAGHRHIGIAAGILEHPIYRDIMAGFRGALAEDKIAVEPQHIVEFSSLLERSQYEKLRMILSAANQPTAFFAMRDNRAALVYQAADELKIDIPKKLSVISYDNISWVEGSSRGLTTIEQPVEQIGRNAVVMLQEWHNTVQRPATPCLLTGRLIERHSIRSLLK